MKRINYLIISILFVCFTSCREHKKGENRSPNEHPFTALISPAGASSSLPYLTTNGHKTLLSWVEKVGDSLTIFNYASLSDGKWQPKGKILQGTDWFVNWADFPMIAENQGNLWSHVLQKSSEGTYSYDIKMNLLPKGSSFWQTKQTLHTDATPTEHGFVTVLPYKNDFFVSWLDGRNTEENSEGERGAMTLRTAEVTATGVVSKEYELDDRVCDCCQTTAAITANGPVVLYRDRSETEVRDISIVRQLNGKWTAPMPLYKDDWQIKGCPVNGPKAAAIGNSLAVAWFTAAQQKPRVQLIFSNDGGASFRSPIQIATGNVLGRVDIVLVSKESAIISWMETKEQQTLLKAIKVAASGKVGNTITVANMTGSRKSGFPQMEVVNDKVYFAYTALDNKESRIETGFVHVAAF